MRWQRFWVFFHQFPLPPLLLPSRWSLAASLWTNSRTGVAPQAEDMFQMIQCVAPHIVMSTITWGPLKKSVTWFSPTRKLIYSCSTPCRLVVKHIIWESSIIYWLLLSAQFQLRSGIAPLTLILNHRQEILFSVLLVEFISKDDAMFHFI